MEEPPYYVKPFPNKLLALRKLKGLTRPQLAKIFAVENSQYFIADCSQYTIRDMENGTKGSWDRVKMEIYVLFFGRQLDDVCEPIYPKKIEIDAGDTKVIVQKALDLEATARVLEPHEIQMLHSFLNEHFPNRVRFKEGGMQA